MIACQLHPLMTSTRPDWYTPAHVIDRAIRVMGGIDLDPASDAQAAAGIPAARYYTAAEDGLALPWAGRVWLNPPYGRQVGKWIDKLIGEYQAGRVTMALVLLAARPDTRWMASLRAWPRCYLRGRLHFSGHDNAAPFPSVIVAVGCNLGAFREAFGDLGDVYELARERPAEVGNL